jgi:predicted ester cyclase
MNRSAFPDIRITVEDQVAEGDKVATRVTVRGTHRGELEGMPPSGKRIEISAITIDRFSGASSWRRGSTPMTWACCGS